MVRNYFVKKIIEQFPGNFERYIEVFGGAGWVLFASNSHAKMEVYNDVNGELVNLFRMVKHHPEAMQKELEWLLISREIFLNELDKNINCMTDIQRAARYFILIKQSFGTGLHSFSASPRNMQQTINYLKMVSERLDRVVIENVDFEYLIKTYDREPALFYLDPPYYKAEKYYADRFKPEDHLRLKNKLDNIKGKFILSYNDCQEIRELYSNYKLVEVERQDNLTTKGQSSRYKELIIKNY